MSVYKKNSSKKLSRIGALKSSVFFLFIALIALLSLWLPILFS